MYIGIFFITIKNNEIIKRKKVSYLVASFNTADLLRYKGILYKKRVADSLVYVKGYVFRVYARYIPWPIRYLPKQVLRLLKNSYAS